MTHPRSTRANGRRPVELNADRAAEKLEELFEAAAADILGAVDALLTQKQVDAADELRWRWRVESRIESALDQAYECLDVLTTAIAEGQRPPPGGDASSRRGVIQS